jgi:hypothetical protein
MEGVSPAGDENLKIADRKDENDGGHVAFATRNFQRSGNGGRLCNALLPRSFCAAALTWQGLLNNALGLHALCCPFSSTRKAFRPIGTPGFQHYPLHSAHCAAPPLQVDINRYVDDLDPPAPDSSPVIRKGLPESSLILMETRFRQAMYWIQFAVLYIVRLPAG